MKEFFPQIDIRTEEAEAIARGLYAVAQSDGEVHPREMALISEFFAANSDNPADFAALERSATISPEDLAAQLGGDDIRHLFVKTALLMAHADGTYGQGEADCIKGYAAAMGIDEAELNEMDSVVKEFLLAQLAHIQNVDAVIEVKKELDL
ncbi:hypothetical protein [Haliangium sp.]|uniref:hypothetical protein n=1 Tax=Haliangium sp. TaxID=2663208 RepID=UPI003D141E3C